MCDASNSAPAPLQGNVYTHGQFHQSVSLSFPCNSHPPFSWPFQLVEGSSVTAGGCCHTVDGKTERGRADRTCQQLTATTLVKVGTGQLRGDRVQRDISRPQGALLAPRGRGRGAEQGTITEPRAHTGRSGAQGTTGQS